MHFTWIHLVFNISQIILFGYILEKKLTVYELLGLFFISIIIGGILSLIMVGLLDPQWTFMGSSGFGNGFLGCAWILKMKKVQKKFYNSLWFYFYLLATIFYAILPIINVIFVLDNISYILLNVGIMFIHLICVLVGIIYGHFIYKRIKSRNTIENHKK
jgi:membrane associated rhomboid family serine protease